MIVASSLVYYSRHACITRSDAILMTVNSMKSGHATIKKLAWSAVSIRYVTKQKK